MRESTFSKHLALILGFFGIFANLGGTLVSFFTGIANVSKAQNWIVDASVCFTCTISLSLIFYYLCFVKKKYDRFNFVAITFSGFISFPAMYIATGNFICGFPFYMMIIPIYYGFSIPLNKMTRALPLINLIYFVLLFILTFISPYFPGRTVMPNISVFQNAASFASTYLFLFYACYFVSRQFTKQNSKLEESEKRYRELSSKDELTGLYNRRSLDNRAEQGFNCAIMYDIDFFKRINDTYGHQTGDEALQLLSNIIMKHCSNEFELYRYGGEEFVILSRLSDSQTLDLFKKVMDDVRKNFIVEGNNVTVSAGIASFCKDFNRTLKIADENLYLAKTDGRNKIYMNGLEITA